MTTLKKYYGSTADVIINTSSGDIVVIVNLDFFEILQVGDTICMAESVENDDNDKVKIVRPKWLERIENFNGSKVFGDELYLLLADTGFRIDEKWFDVKHCVAFITDIDNVTDKQLSEFLIKNDGRLL